MLLAAGGSRRFGSAKLLARFGGEALLRRAVRAALGCRPGGCVVVLGARAHSHARVLRGYPVRVAINTRWRSGIASSLKTGIHALPPEAPAALVVLADQIAVGPAELELVQAAWRRHPGRLVAARAGDVRLPPAVLPRRVFAEVRRLRGDRGAGDLLRDTSRDVIEIEMLTAALDIDHRADLQRFGRRQMRLAKLPNA